MADRRDDMAKVAQGALSVASGLAEEMRAMARAGTEALTARMDLVRREEFEAMRDVAIRAAEAVAALEARVATLEAAGAAQAEAQAQAGHQAEIARAAQANPTGGEGSN